MQQPTNIELRIARLQILSHKRAIRAIEKKKSLQRYCMCGNHIPFERRIDVRVCSIECGVIGRNETYLPSQAERDYNNH